jgi:hypothetical protein
MSEKIANRLSGQLEQPERAAFINLTFETLLARQPDEAELAECLAYCEKLAALFKDEKSTRRCRHH